MAAATAAATAALRPHLSGRGGIPNPTLQSLSFVSPLPFHHRRCRRGAFRSNASSYPSPPPLPEKEAEAVPTAESCVNLGLELFSKGRVRDALEQFDNALELDPNPIEAQAALYNKACCHAYREESKKAADCLRTALRDYNLKFGTILNDPDLVPFRASPEFKELQEEALRGGEDVGSGFRRDLKLISEVQAPFRGVRRFFYVALTAAAGISTFFTIPRLILAVQGGDGAPDLLETAGNAAINIGATKKVLLCWWLCFSGKTRKKSSRSHKFLVMKPFQGYLCDCRPIALLSLCNSGTLLGSKASVTRAMQRAERYRTELLKRGVLLIPVVFGASQNAQTKPRGFGTTRSAASVPSVGDDFEKRSESIAAKSRLRAEVRFKADIISTEQWESWIRDQQESEGVTPGEDVYIILRLDGRVRRSGRGMPNWNDILQEVPRLENLLSKLER